MATVTVYGASDDLAEIEGDFYDEFEADCYERGAWIFNSGTRVEMWSDEHSGWRLRAVSVADEDKVKYGERPGYPEDMTCTVTGDYTEVVWVRSYKVASPNRANRI